MRVVRPHPGDRSVPEARRAVAVGVFDGLHLGHLHVLAVLRERAAASDLEVCVLTFDPHPLAVVAPEHAPRMLTTLERRIELLEELGVDTVVVLAFDDEVRSLSPAGFTSDLLVGSIGASVVVVGEDFRFGLDRTGHVGLLREMGSALGFETEVIPLVGGDSPVSSTRIRDMVAAGDVSGAAAALGRPHEVAGEVVAGDGRGRSIGVPTANIGLPPGLAVPGRGVYAVRAGRHREESLAGVANVGVRPTFGGEQEVVEVHLFDVDEDLYSQPLRVRFVERIRDERRFPDAGSLVAQIRVDMEEARALLS